MNICEGMLVEIKDNVRYTLKRLSGKYGIVKKIDYDTASSANIGVHIYGLYDDMGDKGLCWFMEKELNILQSSNRFEDCPNKTFESAKQDVKDLLENYKNLNMLSNSGKDMQFGAVCALERLLNAWD